MHEVLKETQGEEMIDDRFRIWNKKLNCWHFGSTNESRIKNQTDNISLFGEVILMGSFLYPEDHQQEYKDTYDGSLSVINDLEVSHFIGQVDKYGRKIFEGDILSSGNENSLVVWDSWFSSFRLLRDEDCEDLSTYICSKNRIIGNKFENPDLEYVGKQ